MEQADLFIDPGSLGIYDSRTIEFQPEQKEQYIQKITQQNFLNLYAQIQKIKLQNQEQQNERKLEHQVKDFEQDENLIELPTPSIIFPRFRTLPEKPLMTKWEEFAKKKGIKKQKKRSRMVWSEEVKDWVPRYGGKSIKSIKNKLDIIREAKPGQEYDDPFKQSQMEKSVQRKKQKVQELHNQLRKKGLDPSKVLRKEKQQQKKGQQKGSIKDRKKQIKEAMQNSKVATASMGKFDHKTNKEIQTKKIRVREKVPDFKDVSSEHKRNKGILKKIL